MWTLSIRKPYYPEVYLFETEAEALQYVIDTDVEDELAMWATQCHDVFYVISQVRGGAKWAATWDSDDTPIKEGLI